MAHKTIPPENQPQFLGRQWGQYWLGKPNA